MPQEVYSLSKPILIYLFASSKTQSGASFMVMIDFLVTSVLSVAP